MPARVAQRDQGDDEDDDAENGQGRTGQAFSTPATGELAGDSPVSAVQTSMPRRRAER